MTDANRLSDTILQEIGHLKLNYIDESEEELIEEDIEDIPPSLLRYLETSKSRAADCQRLFLDKSAGVEGGFHKCTKSEEHVSFGLESPLDEGTLRKSSEGKLEDHQCVEMNNGNQKRLKDKIEGINQIVIRKAEDGGSESREVKQENIQTGPHEEPLHNEAVTWTSSLPESPHRDSTNIFSEAAPRPQQPGLCQTDLPVVSSSVSAEPTQDWLPEHTEHKRLSWMKECTSWTKLSLHNKRKRGPSFRRHRGPQKAAEAIGLPPLPPQSLLGSTGVKSLTEVTTVTLEDLPGCGLSTLALCSQLQLLSLRRCGLRSLNGINQLQKLCCIDVQENDISFVDCNNMKSLRILKLSHNRLTSIHGLAGAENLDVLDLSHNSITRVSGLESMKRLQKLSLDHNELISTTGLSDMYTLLHLSCSHNHLTSVEGLENNALLHTLDLRANSLAEPPRLNNQVLLRELHLGDNSISCLQGLSACWLPLMQHLSVAKNRLTELPTLADYVSLEKLDLQFNCISELQNVCESLEGCHSLREVHLTGNPLQQESGWSSALLKAVPGLQAADGTLGSSAVGRSRWAPGSFLSLCQAHLQEASELQQQHSKELRQASSSLQAAKISCRHLGEALQLAVEQRFAHEYDDTEAEKHWGRNRVNYSTFDQNSAESCIQDRLQPAVSVVNGGGAQAAVKKEEMVPPNADIPPVTNHQDHALHSAAAVVIQQRWGAYRQKCGNARNLSTGDSRDNEAKTKTTSVTPDQAATVIQAFWRGFSLRRRLKAALATVPVSDMEEDDFFEEDVFEELDAFFFKQWKVLSGDDVQTRHHPVPQQQKSFPESSRPSGAPLSLRSREGWADAGQVEPDELSVSPLGFNRSESPTSDVNSLSKTSEEIMEEWGFTHSGTALLMLKRAQKMKSKKLQKNKDPCIPFANCNLQMTQSKKTQHGRNHGRVGKAELGLQQAERKARAQRWPDAQSVHWESDSEPFLPEIRAESRNGSRARLSADQGNTEHPHQACGLSCNSSSAVRPQKQNSHPPQISLCHARRTLPPPKQVTLAPSKKERTSFRDNPVQLSGGWGGGRKKTK